MHGSIFHVYVTNNFSTISQPSTDIAFDTENFK